MLCVLWIIPEDSLMMSLILRDSMSRLGKSCDVVKGSCDCHVIVMSC